MCDAATAIRAPNHRRVSRNRVVHLIPTATRWKKSWNAGFRGTTGDANYHPMRERRGAHRASTQWAKSE